MKWCLCQGCAACGPGACGALYNRDDPRTPGARCAACQPIEKKRRNTDAPGRPSAAQRGYGPEWRRISAEVTANARCCHWCGGPFTKDNPATADHIVPVARGGTHERSNLVPSCRRCNSQRGGQMRKRKR
jgi:5-methylcytosine-specific restriction protein A